MLEKSINATTGCTNDIEMSSNRKSIWPIIEHHYNQVEASDNDKSALTRLLHLISLPTEYQQYGLLRSVELMLATKC